MSDLPAPPQIDATTARQLAGDGALLLDVREPVEWQAGHAPDAVHIPLGDLGARLEELPRDAQIVAVCRAGHRSNQAAIALRGAGLDVVNLVGGMQAWAAAGHDVVTDDGGAGQVI
ncbi:MAG TPA: rhodanese-like domain-containing protein [Acidimicrobiales bacterium]|nr:rhodanese-like domain-containing protein [Acidimicrobiales bacterium]